MGDGKEGETLEFHEQNRALYIKVAQYSVNVAENNRRGIPFFGCPSLIAHYVQSSGLVEGLQ